MPPLSALTLFRGKVIMFGDRGFREGCMTFIGIAAAAALVMISLYYLSKSGGN